MNPESDRKTVAFSGHTSYDSLSQPVRSESLHKLRGLAKELDSEIEGVDTTLKRQWIFPCFKDGDLEFAFANDQHAHFAKRCEHSLPILGCIMLIRLVSWGGSTTRLAWHMRCIDAPLLLFYGTLWALLKTARDTVEAWLQSSVTLTLVYFVTTVCFTPDRTAEFLDWSGNDWKPRPFMEAEVVVVLCGCLAAAGVVFRLATWRFLFLHHFIVAIYMVVVGPLGSAEYDVQSQSYSLSPRMLAHIAMAFRFWIIGAVIYFARLLSEIAERANFAKIYELEQEVVAKQTINEELQAEQLDADQRCAALEGNYGEIDVSRPFISQSVPLPSLAASDASTARTDDSSGKAPQQSAKPLPAARKLTVPLPEKWLQPLPTGGQDPIYPNARLVEALKGKTVDWARVREIAEKIPEEWYDLRSFFDDCIACFPELQLFVCIPPDEGTSPQERSNNELEYQRTIGALFAVYWLIRVEVDGPAGFSNGVDDTWQAIKGASKEITSQDTYMVGRVESMKNDLSFLSGFALDGGRSPRGDRSNPRESKKETPVQKTLSRKSNQMPNQMPAMGKTLSNQMPAMGKTFSQATTSRSSQVKRWYEMDPSEKRRAFEEDEAAWRSIERLVSEAGCDPSEEGSTEQIMALLCLTAFHDIMKVPEFLPTVDPNHEAFNGHAPGTKIHDHDAALGYVLKHFPELLPSFAGLPSDRQRCIAFTQGNMKFNHGSFVQAEAPPGAALTGFKHTITTNGMQSSDIAFYFLHWFTDVAGASARPLGGAEKFVLKCPHSVLRALLWSVPFLSKLAEQSETEVMQTYLQARWKDDFQNISLPTDAAAVARMRLAVMTQRDTAVGAFGALSSGARRILSEELAHTGVKEQLFENTYDDMSGPAFAISSSAAFLQQHSNRAAECTLALTVLARVLFAARTLWPLEAEAHGTTVTIQVGELREKSMELIMGQVLAEESGLASSRRIWVMERTNDLEGVLKLKSAADVNGLIASQATFCLIDFDPKTHDPLQNLPLTRKSQAGKGTMSDAGEPSIAI